MRRLYWGVALILVVIAVAFVAQRIFGGATVAPRLVSAGPVAAIGSGEGAVGVSADGTVLTAWPAPEEGSVPQLPLESPPKGGRLRGPALEQVRVLAAVPAPLRPYVASSGYGESGVSVTLDSGIELRFGSAAAAGFKWRAAATVLADPELTAADYVDVSSPRHPAVAGSGHTLPPLP